MVWANPVMIDWSGVPDTTEPFPNHTFDTFCSDSAYAMQCSASAAGPASSAFYSKPEVEMRTGPGNQDKQRKFPQKVHCEGKRKEKS